MRGNHKDLLLALAPLIEIAAIVPCEHFRGTFDFYALGLEIFVDVHISLDINGISQQFGDKGPLQRLVIDLDGVFDKVPGYIAIGIARLRIHLKHELGKIHFRIFHQLLCLDPVHNDRLGIKAVWCPATHIVAFGTPGIESVLHTHLDALTFKLCKEMQILSIARPIGVEVSNFSVQETNSTSYCLNSSMSFAKSTMERLIRSSL